MSVKTPTLSGLERAVRSAVVLGLGVSLLASCRLAAQSFPLHSPKGLNSRGVKAESATYHGRKAIRVLSLQPADTLKDIAAGREGSVPAAASAATGGSGLIVIPGVVFHNGSIDVDLAGKPVEGAPPEARGFVGVVFRMSADASSYEYVYLRPTNGRSEDQQRRNHTTQYAAHPDFGFFRLRSESPGKYESYVDLMPGEWAKVRIEVSGTKMRLFVNGAKQPTLLVNDLKLGDTEGAIRFVDRSRNRSAFCQPEDKKRLTNGRCASTRAIDHLFTLPVSLSSKEMNEFKRQTDETSFNSDSSTSQAGK